MEATQPDSRGHGQRHGRSGAALSAWLWSAVSRSGTSHREEWDWTGFLHAGWTPGRRTRRYPELDDLSDRGRLFSSAHPLDVVARLGRHCGWRGRIFLSAVPRGWL